MHILTANTAQLHLGIPATAAIVPAHYASEEQVARALAALGGRGAALIEGKLPTTKAIRSGDLGEIYATEWIDAHSGAIARRSSACAGRTIATWRCAATT